MRFLTLLYLFFFTFTTSAAILKSSDTPGASDSPIKPKPLTATKLAADPDSSHSAPADSSKSSPSKPTKNAPHKPLSTLTSPNDFPSDDSFNSNDDPRTLSPHEFGDKTNGSYFISNFTGPIPPPEILSNNLWLWGWMSDNLPTTTGAYFRFINSPQYLDGIPDRFPQWVGHWDRRIDSKEEWESWVREAPGGFRKVW